MARGPSRSSPSGNADVPNNCCVRVREGGKALQKVHVDRGCCACMLGGSDRRTLFIVATEWRGMDKIAEVGKIGPDRYCRSPFLHQVQRGREEVDRTRATWRILSGN
jgi:hypothetical protein